MVVISNYKLTPTFLARSTDECEWYFEFQTLDETPALDYPK